MILITFGGRAYDRQIGLQRVSCEQLGIHHVVFDDRWLLGTSFYELNRWIFERQPQHGFGFCSWKPYIIEYAIRTFLALHDVVMYLDADTYPVGDIRPLFDMAEKSAQSILLFEEQGCVNKTWIKGECFLAMGTGPGAGEAMHACGRFQLFQQGPLIVEQFLAEWQAYSLNKRCQFHEGSAELFRDFDDTSFIRNSCEQSVLSLLAHKYDLPLHRTPDQNGWPVAHDGTYKPDDKYPQLFIQDGRRGDTSDLSGSRYRNV
jgi:hypothetical protein